ncbi:MAG: prepilin-type N-terminal cleavage/methylation domain-containing protein [bacterium]|nr:prepilin-type N-terminal cleavage/methylation domain-containing protein [bacterium]
MPNQIQVLKTKKNDVRAFTPHHFYNGDLRVVGRSYIAIVSKFKNAFGKNGAGFTLIEVMVVVAIMGIMAVLSIVSLGNGRIQRDLEANAREFAGVVREAQNYALTGKQTGGGAVCAFSVTWTGSSTYELGSTASGDCGGSVTSLANYSLKNGVTLNNFGTISFALPWARTGGGQANFSKGSDTYSVCISADGKISDQIGAVCP